MLSRVKFMGLGFFQCAELLTARKWLSVAQCRAAASASMANGATGQRLGSNPRLFCQVPSISSEGLPSASFHPLVTEKESTPPKLYPTIIAKETMRHGHWRGSHLATGVQHSQQMFLDIVLFLAGRKRFRVFCRHSCLWLRKSIS